MSQSMQEEWQAYKQACYPTGIHATQNKECHQAFFAGALQVLKRMEEISELPEYDAAIALSKLNREVLEICSARAMQAEHRN